MISELSFLNHDWMGVVVVGALILMAVFIWKELSQAGKHRIFIRLFLVIVAVLSLVLLALKPLYTVEDNSRTGVLITEGHVPSQLDSLRKMYRNLKQIRYSRTASLIKELDSVSAVVLMGQGLQDFDLWQLENIPATYLGGSSPAGIVKLKYNREPTVGNTLRVSGRYDRPRNGNRLILRGPAGLGLDSISLKEQENQQFSLATKLKLQGKLVYFLAEKDSLGNLIKEEPLPLKVLGKEHLRVLLINDFPTFESKYLKNFLAEQGHEVLVRSQLTRGRYKFEYFNMGRNPLYSFTKRNLEGVDLLIIDARAYRGLSRNSKSALEHAVKEQGMGLFIQADSRFFGNTAIFSKINFERGSNTKSTLQQRPKVSLDKYPYRFGEEGFLLTAFKSAEETVVAYKRVGQGRIGTSILRNTYELVLKGEHLIYQEFWTAVISQMSKRKRLAAVWDPKETFVYVDHPYSFEFRSSIADPRISSLNEGRIPLIKDVNIRDLWRGTAYPSKMGWNRQILDGDSTNLHDYYVIDSSSWRSLNTWRTMEMNKRYFQAASETAKTKTKLMPIPSYWFLLAFLLSTGFLWLEPKLGS